MKLHVEIKNKIYTRKHSSRIHTAHLPTVRALPPDLSTGRVGGSMSNTQPRRRGGRGKGPMSNVQGEIPCIITKRNTRNTEKHHDNITFPQLRWGVVKKHANSILVTTNTLSKQSTIRCAMLGIFLTRPSRHLFAPPVQRTPTRTPQAMVPVQAVQDRKQPIT